MQVIILPFHTSSSRKGNLPDTWSSSKCLSKNKTPYLLGHLAGSIGRAWDSWPWDPEFKPHARCRDYLKIYTFTIFICSWEIGNELDGYLLFWNLNTTLMLHKKISLGLIAGQGGLLDENVLTRKWANEDWIWVSQAGGAGSTKDLKHQGRGKEKLGTESKWAGEGTTKTD